MSKSKKYRKKIIERAKVTYRKEIRKHLNFDSLIALMLEDFQDVIDHRAGNQKISLDDILMSALAMFSLKDPSLLAFDNRRKKEPENLHTIFGITDIPCDSQIREVLDPIELESLRAPFLSAFRQFQRGKGFEKMTFLNDSYILSGDGTGFYSSGKVSSPSCMIKKHKNGKITYYQQMYAAAFVHPDRKEVIPVFPEMITKKDGSTKNDCERNASGRFYKKFRQEHPHLKVIVVEDALGSNAPHVELLQSLNLNFILGVKPDGHKFLFSKMQEAVKEGTVTELHYPDPEDAGKDHFFRYINQAPLNQSNPDVLVNFLEYWEVGKDGKMQKFSWVTDIPITPENVFDIMRAGRARWKIENETFNTLKNQGYNLGHNYGLGEKNLSAVFCILMMLAFLLDQIQQASCWLFQEAWETCESKRLLWESVRSLFHSYRVDSMETIYRAIAHGFKRHQLKDVCQA